MEQKKLYFRLMLAAAAALGVLNILPSYLLYVFGVQATDVTGYQWWNTLYTVVVFACVFIYCGRQAAVARDPQGYYGYSYGAAFSFSILAALMSALVYAFLGWLLMNVIAPEMVQKMLDMTREKIAETPGVTEQIMESSVSMAKFFTTFAGMFISSILSMAFWGGLVGLVTSAYVKKAPSAVMPEQE